MEMEVKYRKYYGKHYGKHYGIGKLTYKYEEVIFIYFICNIYSLDT